MIAFLYFLMRDELIRPCATLHPVIVPKGKRLAMYFLILAASVAATPHWLLGSEPTDGKFPWYLDPARIDDDTPRPTGDDR